MYNAMISVCMATYNGEKYIKEQIDSILPQLADGDELVVSDDGSSDNTCDIVRAYGDTRIKLFFNNGYHGYVGNFENALHHAHGDYIFLCDQDDVWHPGKVEVVMRNLQKYDLVTHNAELVDENGVSMGKTYFDCTHKRIGFFSNLLETRHLGCCMAINRKVLNDALPFVSRKRGHDYWIGCVAELKYKVKFIDDVLIFYRRHRNNASSCSSNSKNSFKAKFLKRLDMAYSLFLRFILKR